MNLLLKENLVHHKDRRLAHDQDRCDLKNWRPISLLNVDAKIASKVIAERMKRLLPGLLHHNQSGYIPGRSISENIRSILDIMEIIY